LLFRIRFRRRTWGSALVKGDHFLRRGGSGKEEKQANTSEH